MQKNLESREIKIFTDGASKGNPGPGGWGSIVIIGNKVYELGGYEAVTTNNRMEITAAFKALEFIIDKSDIGNITLHSDSFYLINGATKWIHGWKKNGWMTKEKQEVLNKDLWISLDELLSRLPHIKWIYVGGHVGVAGNERCDEIATSFAMGKKMELFDGDLSDYHIEDVLDVSHDPILMKNKKKSGSKTKAYSYVSVVGGEVKIHKSWEECEKRVKGVRGAKFKKALDSAQEKDLVAEYDRLV